MNFGLDWVLVFDLVSLIGGIMMGASVARPRRSGRDWRY